MGGGERRKIILKINRESRKYYFVSKCYQTCRLSNFCSYPDVEDGLSHKYDFRKPFNAFCYTDNLEIIR